MPVVERVWNDESAFISNVHLDYGADKKSVDVQWSWPRDSRYSYCFVFDVTVEEEREGIDLERMLQERRPVDIISTGLYHAHRSSLTHTGTRAYLYPARWDNSISDYMVLDQPSDNRSEVFQLKEVIKCRISYESMDRFLRTVQWKKAVIQLNGVPHTLEEEYAFLAYHCVGAGRDNTHFGIDLGTFGGGQRLELIIDKREKIKMLTLTPEQSRRMELVQIES